MNRKTLKRAAFVAVPCILLFCSGCATSEQRRKGMDNNDARQEAVWDGVFWTFGRMIFGPPDETKNAE